MYVQELKDKPSEHCTLLYFSVLHCTAYHVLYNIISHCTILYCIIICCIVLYCTIPIHRCTNLSSHPLSFPTLHSHPPSPPPPHPPPPIYPSSSSPYSSSSYPYSSSSSPSSSSSTSSLQIKYLSAAQGQHMAAVTVATLKGLRCDEFFCPFGGWSLKSNIVLM